ncbi:BON1-associated protein 2-like [Argentina anserina]|uniref:BON1-associated protein 2-like n=1 Tax=Argentina anserina TaxID=57926 RepID=UPI0021765748|nr:BON1-associated protein 2-like [Potentilla anserina]
MAESSSRLVEITVLSAENLEANRKPFKRNSCVTIRNDAPISATRLYRTAETDCEGGGHRWNEKLVIELPSQARNLIVEVHSKNGARTIGAASIPVSDFIGGWVPENYLHFLSYRLRDERGVRNGIVNISVRIKVPEGVASTYGKRFNSGCATSSSHTTLIYPAGDNSGVATGVPVNWNSYPRIQY